MKLKNLGDPHYEIAGAFDHSVYYAFGNIDLADDRLREVVVELKSPVGGHDWLYDPVLFVPMPLKLLFWSVLGKSPDIDFIGYFVFCVWCYHGLSDWSPNCLENKLGP